MTVAIPIILICVILVFLNYKYWRPVPEMNFSLINL